MSAATVHQLPATPQPAQAPLIVKLLRVLMDQEAEHEAAHAAMGEAMRVEVKTRDASRETKAQLSEMMADGESYVLGLSRGEAVTITCRARGGNKELVFARAAVLRPEY